MSRRRRVLSWVGKGALISFGVAVALLFVAAAVLSIYLDEERLAELASSRASEALEGRIVAERLDYDFPSRVELHDVRVVSPSGNQVLYAEKLSARIGLAALTQRVIRIKGVRGTNIRLSLEQNREGELELAQAFLPAGPDGASETEDGGGPWGVQVDVDELTSIELQGAFDSSRYSLEGGTLSGGTVRVQSGQTHIETDIALPALSFARGKKGEPPLEARAGLSGRVSLSYEDALSLFADLRGSGRVGEAELNELHAEARWTDGRLEIQELLARHAGGRVSLGGAFDLLGKNRTHELEARVERLALARLLRELGVDGAEAAPRMVEGTAQLAGGDITSLETNLTGTLNVAGISQIKGLGLGDAASLRIEANAKKEMVEIRRLSVRGSNIALLASGNLPLGSDLPVQLQVDASVKTWSLPREPGARVARASLRASVEGTITSPRVDAVLTGEGIRVEPLTVERLRIPASLERGVLRVRGGEIWLAEGRARVVSASVELFEKGGVLRERMPLEGRLTLNDIDVKQLSAVKLVEGEISGELLVDGFVMSPRVRADVKMNGTRIGGVELDRARLRAIADQDRLQVRELEVSAARGGRLSASGDLTWESFAYRAELEANAIPLQWVDEVAGLEFGVSGTARVSARGNGTLERPKGEVTVRSTEVQLNGVSLGDMSAEAVLGTNEVRGEARVRGPAGEVFLKGEYSLRDEELKADLRGNGLELARIQRAVGSQPSVAGTLQVGLDIEGQLLSPCIEGKLSVAGLNREGDLVASGRLNATVDSECASGSAERYEVFAQLGDSVDLMAKILPSPFLVEARTTFDELHLEDIYSGFDEANVSVVVSGSARTTYSASAGLSEARLRIDDLSASADGATASLAQPVEARLEDGELVVPQIVLTDERSTLRAKGSVGEQLDLAAEGTVDLSLASAFVPAIASAEGALSLDLEATGPVEEPVLRGTLEIAEPVELRLRGFSDDVLIQTGSVALEEGKLSIDDLRGEIGSGTFHADGSIVLDGFEPVAYDVELSGRGLGYSTERLLLEANVDLELMGEGSVPDVAGRVELMRGRYRRDFKLQDFNIVAEEEEPKQPLAQRLPWLRRMDLDVRATSAEPVEIIIDQGPFGLQAQLRADLRITGNALDPTINGRISGDEGTIEFPATDLDIVSMSVDFLPAAPRKAKTDVSLRAEGEVTPEQAAEGLQRTYLVTMILEGDVEQMELDFQADPPLSRLEALSLLVAGTADLRSVAGGEGGGDGGGPGLDAALALAGSQLASPVTGFIENRLEELINLELDLGASLSGEELTVTAAKQLTDRIRLEGWHAQALQAQATRSGARAQLLVTNRLFLEAALRQFSGIPEGGQREEEDSGELELKYRILGD